MKPLSRDTPLEVERVWLEAQRKLGRLERLRRAVELTSLCWRGARAASARAHPEASPEDLDRLLLTERYGEEIARGVVELRRAKGFYE